MNIKKFCIAGLKFIAAGLAGIAAFFGIGKLMGNKSKACDGEEINSDCSPDESCDTELTEDDSDKTFSDKADSIAVNLRKAQDTCGKIFSVIQSLTLVVDNLSRVFGNNSNQLFNQPVGMSNNWMYNQPQPIPMGNGDTWYRVSPHIIMTSSQNSHPERNPYTL